MDLETVIVYATLIGGCAVAIWKAYEKVFADGKITLDEVLELAEDVQELADTLPSLGELKKMKKAELVALCEQHDLDPKGVKADLVERLKTLTVSME